MCNKRGGKISGIFTKLTYRQLQTMRHALFYFMQREHATKEDLQSEKALLEKVNSKIEVMREKMK